MKSESARIADQHRRAYAGPAWSGPCVQEALRGVDARRAWARPLPRAHSIAEIVLHLAAWEHAVERRLAGEPREVSGAEDWPAPGPAGDAAWAEVLDRLETRHRALAAALEQLTDARLGATVPGQQYSVHFMVHGEVQHLLYHAGQIALLAKA